MTTYAIIEEIEDVRILSINSFFDTVVTTILIVRYS